MPRTTAWEARTNRAERIVREVRAALPEPVRRASAAVAVRLDRRVPRHWLDDGDVQQHNFLMELVDNPVGLRAINSAD